MDDNREILEKLLLDIDILNELDKWTQDVNFFEISGMVNREIKHSNTLAWFFDPNENHFLKDQFIRRFLQKVISRNVSTVVGLDIFDVSLIDYNTFTVKREWKNIDILIISNELKILFVIENKVYAIESKGQLNKYFSIIEDDYSDFKKVFIYLTREGEEPSDMEHWCIANYDMIIDSLEESINHNKTVSEKTQIIVKDYVAMIRRNFGMDKELQETCRRIYLKHKKAFDLIYQVASNTNLEFSEYIKNWLEENKEKYNLNYNPEFSSNTLIRFTTPFIDEMFPFDDEKRDGWGFGHSFMYEIGISKDSIYIIGVLSNFERPNSKLFMNSGRGTKWRRVMSKKEILAEEDIAEGLTPEVKTKLNRALSNAIKKHIFDFENKIKKHYIEQSRS